jgi:hypothetical protein
MNDLIPTGPSQRDIAEMARLRAIMNGTNVPAVPQPQQAHYSGGSAGTQRPLHESRAPSAPAYMPTFGTSREEVDAMKNILNKLNHLSGDDRSMEQVVATPRQPLVETSSFTQPQLGSGPFEVLAIIKESNGKEVNRYSVVDANRRDVVGGLTLRETATAIMKLMNKGLALESTRVQEVINLEEDYNRNRLQTASHRQRYQRSMELGETAAAQVFKDRFNVAKANALAAQDEIKSIADSLR